VLHVVLAVTAVRDLKTGSYLQWKLRSTAPAQPNYELEIQVMYRTYDLNGVLFSLSSANGSKSGVLEVGIRF
jgi:hypothetical protein